MDIDAKNFSTKELRDWLRRLNLPTSGNKNDLVLRLLKVPENEREIMQICKNDDNAENEEDNENEAEQMNEKSYENDTDNEAGVES